MDAEQLKHLHQSGAKQPPLRALLALSRVSHLPTVWSNCLAGWWLGGGGNFAKLPLLFLGVSALYTGGMFLNDAFDADFDRQRRAERPIPSGAISLPAVWRWGLGWLGLGALCMTAVGKTTGMLTLVLLLCIIIYDATHKVVTASPWLMGVCRFWVYVIAGSAGATGVNGGPIWCGAALALYVAGLGYLAQHESSGGRDRRQRRTDLVRCGAGVVCGRTGLSGAARKFPRAGSLLAIGTASRADRFRDADKFGGIPRSGNVVVARARAVDCAPGADDFSSG